MICFNMAADVRKYFLHIFSIISIIMQYQVIPSYSSDLVDREIVVKPLFHSDNLFFQVLEPESIRYTYKIRQAKNFGGLLNQSYASIDLVPTVPADGCSPISNQHLIEGNVALVERGGCSFLSKTIQAENAGAIIIVITDEDPDNDSMMIEMIEDGTNRSPKIPAVYLLGRDGYMIKKTLQELDLTSAIINIPVNITGIPIHLLNQPPWEPW
ncbi:unnamed protein product [Owenia fusiformis]|uniref:PA domain-containing protein n=1 Tax=Owenia fusiformis TaxID=6347 RepID=A0A8S4NTF7_OWEFU|nr:unnamed protein product [Owenia fusiformis]